MQQPVKQGMTIHVIHRVNECLQRANSPLAPCVPAPAPQMSQAVTQVPGALCPHAATQAPGALCPHTARGYPAAAWATSLAMERPLVITGCSSSPITTTTSPVSPFSQLRYLRGELSDHCQPPLMSRSFRPIQSVELYPVNRPGANTASGAESVPQPSSVPSLSPPQTWGKQSKLAVTMPTLSSALLQMRSTQIGCQNLTIDVGLLMDLSDAQQVGPLLLTAIPRFLP